jgi:hypothetical protein
LAAINGVSTSVPRDYLLYNAYTHVMNAAGTYTFSMWEDGVFAIRDSQYKLIHSYNGSTLVDTYSGDEEYSDDADLTEVEDCKQEDIYSGQYVKYLFDLVNDPYETTNLYDSTDDDVMTHKEDLYAQAIALLANAQNDYSTMMSNEYDSYCEDTALTVWATYDDNTGPFLDADWDVEFAGSTKSYPSYCTTYSKTN